jgi:acyl-CoA hydrolase
MAEAAPDCMFSSGEKIFVPGSSGEPTALLGRVFAAGNAEIVTSFAPGVNVLTGDMLGPGTRVSGPFMSPGLGALQRTGRYRHLPLSYFGMAKWLRESPPFDVCVIQISSPDAAGLCSLGPSAEFTPSVLRRARRVIAVVNPSVPWLRAAPTVRLADCHTVVETDAPVLVYRPEPADSTVQAIAIHTACFIEDGATLQLGLGKIPHALAGALHSRRKLRLHSGLLSDGCMALAEAGALACDHPHVAAVMLGSAELYAWAESAQLIEMRGVEYTHDPQVVATLDRLVAVNSALEVDLFGQCNLEHADGRAVSGGGGASDFAHAARLAPGGISIIALAATLGGGRISRIRARLGVGAVATLPRTDVDVVVTEHGAADLRGLSVHERAEALIEVAAPAHRADLATEWRDIAGRL